MGIFSDQKFKSEIHFYSYPINSMWSASSHGRSLEAFYKGTIPTYTSVHQHPSVNTAGEHRIRTLEVLSLTTCRACLATGNVFDQPGFVRMMLEDHT
ncbi:hypothetical protein HZU73_08178 [Apis mellifera caucasica]|uniref:Uncharacterized protein LOC107964680 n=1 Tax=Apis mellifera TaxID=7460 RepID=A0A7M7L7U6_APIME|nr:uncharacterized protein LOC107964680 [Apis mellifera]KAG6796770.1 hypothetical protein HZU73_08178 [Apis mellifera caucasica]KAG9436535.1 hypothetical protein HZU67_01492 [Apis mellifera carnica]|eukprot:XP_026297102.1 uncharacterized protein LOC107964680 [Apis mellifera]